MKTVIAALRCLLLAGLLAAAAPAAAQDVGRWTDPTGAWSLDLTGWKAVENSHLEPNELFEVEPLTSPGDRILRMCSASQYVLPPQGGSASLVNSSTTRFGLEMARAVLGDDVQEVTHMIVDGVTIADVRILIGTPSTGTRIDYRVFNVATKQGARHVQISCGARNSLDAQRRAPVQAVLDSLRFLP